MQTALLPELGNTAADRIAEGAIQSVAYCDLHAEESAALRRRRVHSSCHLKAGAQDLSRLSCGDGPPSFWRWAREVERIGGSLEQARTSLEAKIDKVDSDLVLLHADHRNLVDKTGTIEARVDELTPVMSRLESTMGGVLARASELERRVEDAEGRTRRNNIRVIGLPEGAEGRDAEAYSESWLRGLVLAGTLTPFLTVFVSACFTE
ncbi:hypothetical protein NDU88_005320 [Pleurodeles waltl]|uniref:t-SNARE coiled-coil homology domain-containing protein n=1 Tax=Pleurodeles waltl TaxID=8319 RepID=A0AAV7TV14_PLEWA|nr:hypothetical protein NDU88_005320 [Pleurodeles waltl]